ncbi:uncharacterized protein [Cherax quadricarinatus]|uniref:uncharacterized protein n=1 Tax=Cherax quadricarinatus TaxID=27406 RepID=UPI00387E7677
MSINEKLFYGEPSNTRSKYVCILDYSDSEPEVDDPELLDSGDEYLPPDAEVSSDEEERPVKKHKLVKKKKGITIEEYPDEEDIYEDLALQGSVFKVNLCIKKDINCFIDFHSSN